MHTSTLSKVIIALFIILAVSVAGLVAISVMQKQNNTTEDTKAAETTKATVTTVADSDDVTTIDDVTTEKKADDTTKQADVTTEKDPDVTTKQSDVTTEKDPDVTTSDPVQKAPSTFKLSKTYKSNSGTKYLNIRVDITGTANADGTVHLTAKMYLLHWAIGVGKRNCSISIGSASSTFVSEKINTSENKATETLLTTFETDVIYGQSLAVTAVFPFNGTYGTTELTKITINDVITIK